jgi:hypothetical protein
VRAALEWSLHEMLSQGVTSFTEASVGFPAGAARELDAYAALADAGVLKQRVRLCLHWEPGSAATDEVIARRNFYARARVTPDCVKIFLDGVPTDSHTAAMVEPYAGTVAGRSDAASRSGLLLVQQDVLDQAVTRFDRMGLGVKFHAAGECDRGGAPRQWLQRSPARCRPLHLRDPARRAPGARHRRDLRGVAVSVGTEPDQRQYHRGRRRFPHGARLAGA